MQSRVGYHALLAIGAAMLVAACVSVAPVSTTAPSESPGVTLGPGETASPSPAETTAPTDTPTDTPTDASTDAPTPTPTPPSAHPDWPAGAVDSDEASSRVGQTATVCGLVVSTNWVFDETGHPTWLNLDRAYPNVDFNIVIWGEQRRAWPLSNKPEVRYLNKEICVTGLVEQYDSRLQIQDVAMPDIQVIP